MILPGQYDHASPLIQDLAYNQSSTADHDYLKQVTTAMTEAVVVAYEGRRPVQCGFGSGKEPSVAFNRRFRMMNSLTFTHPRQGNPDIVEVAGPTDPEVGAIAAWDRSTNSMLGCVVTFACHATTNPPGVSANYICYLEQAVRGMFGQEVVVVFLNGASGDVTQVDNLSPFRLRSGEASARLVGGRVGAEAVKVVLGMTPGEDVPLDAAVEQFDVPRRAPSPQRVAQARQLITEQNRRSSDWVWAKETLLLDALLASEPVVNVEVQAVQIGPAVFVTTPAEYFCRYGLEIKAASKFPFTYPVSLANGCVGYVPTLEAFGDSGGGYETRLTSYSNLEIAAGNRMRDKGLELVKGMEPGPVFTPAPAPPFQQNAWSYGNVPPQRD